MAIKSDKISNKYAGSMILSQICIDCKEDFAKELKGIMEMIFNVDDQKNPRL